MVRCFLCLTVVLSLASVAKAQCGVPTVGQGNLNACGASQGCNANRQQAQRQLAPAQLPPLRLPSLNTQQEEVKPVSKPAEKADSRDLLPLDSNSVATLFRTPTPTRKSVMANAVASLRR